MARLVVAAFLVIVATMSAGGQSDLRGEIRGIVTDAESGVIPGVTVTIDGADGRKEAVTDAQGGFVFRSLSLGAYRVETTLVGFTPRSGTITLSPGTRRARVTWSLAVSCLTEVQRVQWGPRDAAAKVEHIVHLRVTSDTGMVLWSTHPDCPGTPLQSYGVETLSTLHPSAQELLLWPGEAPLQAGAEYIALIWPGWRTDQQLVLPVESGRVASSVIRPLAGMPVDVALQTLTTWARERR